VDTNEVPAPVESETHASARLGSTVHDLIEDKVLQEIAQGNYVVTDNKPAIISALGAVPKSGGDIIIIHDCSIPHSGSVNNYATLPTDIKCQSIDSAANLIKPGYYMCKIDLLHAYRQVKISKASQNLSGLKWALDGKDTYMYDSKLMFGSKVSPSIFHRLTLAVRWMMARRGFKAVVCYIDNIWLCAPTMQECARIMAELVALLRKLGFAINWTKVIDPCQRITFLGVELDSVAMCKCLPEEKLEKVRQALTLFQARKRASKLQLQSLAGLFAWCAQVVQGGRVFLRRLLDVIAKLQRNDHRVILSGGKSLWSNLMARL
jgi:hypothetical protein